MISISNIGEAFAGGASAPAPAGELSRLDILSSVAKLDSLKDISSLEELSQNEPTVIELLNHYSKRMLDNAFSSLYLAKHQFKEV
jgi:hypothetical protein